MKQSKQTKVRAIIPCAGFGTRVGMKKNQSKEMLLDRAGNTLIGNILSLCNYFNLDPLIISRKEKKDLNKFIRSEGVDLQIINPEGEWADTVLASEKNWYENNILILPDTEFDEAPLRYINIFLHASPIALFTHKVGDGSKWGCVYKDKGGGVHVIEKPQNETKADAWGLIAFKKKVGNELFSSLARNKQVYLTSNTLIIQLTSFHDLTRNKDILKWNKIKI